MQSDKPDRLRIPCRQENQSRNGLHFLPGKERKTDLAFSCFPGRKENRFVLPALPARLAD
jgi:hypothetical protein